MLKVRPSVLVVAAALGFAASIERVDAASNCNPSGAIPCEVIHSLFSKDARQVCGRKRIYANLPLPRSVRPRAVRFAGASRLGRQGQWCG
jgi:hypothetical protein